jgi:hypothetical protein
MRHIAVAFAGTLIFAATFAFSARPAAAHAPDNGDYRGAMRAFVGALDNYSDKLEVAAEAAVVKPELACGAELAELATIAQGMTADLQGTARLAPAHLAAVHAQLTDSVTTMGAQAEAACYDAAAAASVIRAERPAFDWALTQIEFHAKFGGGGL